MNSDFGFRISELWVRGRLLRRLMVAVIALAMAQPASAQLREVQFSTTQPGSGLYTTDIPAGCFTKDGIKLPIAAGKNYTLLSKAAYSGEYSFEVQFDIPDRSEAGLICIELFLVNDTAKRKALGKFTNQSAKAGSDGCRLSYYKDGKAQGTTHGDGYTESSMSTGHSGVMEGLRMHKAGTRVWFMQKMKDHQYRWPSICNYPRTTYFKEDCESFQVGMNVYCEKDATGTVLLKTIRLHGPGAAERDKDKRVFLFDFGPVNQELEDDFCPVSEFTNYSPEKGYGWIVPEAQKVWYDEDGLPPLGDKEIAALGLPPVTTDHAGWYQNWVRTAYWLQVNDKKMFYSVSHGGSYIEFFKQWLDLNTPLERDLVAMARPYQFNFVDLYQKDIEERRGSIYIDDDLSTEFAVDVPNGTYNVILGVGFTASWHGGGEGAKYNVDIEGRTRKQDLGPNWRRPNQHQIRNVIVEDGQMNIRFFVDVRKAMDKFANHDVGTGWMINYIVILPANEKELLSEWEWRIIKRRGEVIRRVTFVPGEPSVTQKYDNFISINGKPLYFLKVMNNYVPGTSDHFTYYCTANTYSAFHSVKGSQHFFKPDWEKLSYSDDYPWDTIDRMNTVYTWGTLCTMHQNDVLSFVPHAVSGEGTPTMDSRGRQNRYNIQPPLNSALGKEIQKEAYTMMANQLSRHPGNAGHFIYEELWHPSEQGYDDQSLIQYWGWLKERYGTIEKLNESWGSKYADFDDIVQPVQGKNEWWEYTPEFVNFRMFRDWAQVQMVKSACDLVRKNEPTHFSWAAKGDYATQTFYPGEHLDMFGWYSPMVAGSIARYFGKASISGGYQLNCEHAYLDGRKQFDHKPGPRRYMGRDETKTIYNEIVSSVFKGTKGFFNEWYSDGMSHMFHRTDMIRDLGPKFKVKHWTGQIGFFEPEAYEGPPVKLERGALAVSAANKMLYRLGHLWLPARPMEPRVLMAMNETSCFLQFFGEKPYADLESVNTRILQSCNLTADFLPITYVKDLSRYKMIVLGDMTQAIAKADVDRLKQYVQSGGKLLIMSAGGLSEDIRVRRYWAKEGEVYPLDAFSQLGGYTLAGERAYHRSLGKTPVRFVKNDVVKDVADGQSAGTFDVDCYYKALPGSTVFLRGKLPKTGEDVDLGLINKDRNVLVIAMPPKGADNDIFHPLAAFVRKAIAAWNVDDRVVMDGLDDAYEAYAGTMSGDGYFLAAACNFSQTATHKYALKLKSLPAGQYAVCDVTAQRPDLVTKPDGAIALKDDPAALRVKVDYVMTAQELADKGIPCEIAPAQGRVLLLRPMEKKVWASFHAPSLKVFAQRGVTVAYGSGEGEKAAAESIQAALARAGAAATAVPADQVKLKKLAHDVRIKANASHKDYREDTAKWFLVETFNNEFLDTDKSVILVGGEHTNPLVKHLGKPGSFAYDKVLDKITADYPGAGRGVINFVDAANSAIYDLRSQARDAIIVGGSDASGTQAAVKELLDLIAKHCKDLNAPPATMRALGDK